MNCSYGLDDSTARACRGADAALDRLNVDAQRQIRSFATAHVAPRDDHGLGNRHVDWRSAVGAEGTDHRADHPTRVLLVAALSALDAALCENGSIL